MALVKRTEEDQIEIVGPYKFIHVRTATVIEEDDVEISRTFHRHQITPGHINPDNDAWELTDYSDQSTEVKAIADALWTDTIKNSYKTYMENLQNTPKPS